MIDRLQAPDQPSGDIEVVRGLHDLAAEQGPQLTDIELNAIAHGDQIAGIGGVDFQIIGAAAASGPIGHIDMKTAPAGFRGRFVQTEPELIQREGVRRGAAIREGADHFPIVFTGIEQVLDVGRRNPAEQGRRRQGRLLLGL